MLNNIQEGFFFVEFSPTTFALRQQRAQSFLDVSTGWQSVSLYACENWVCLKTVTNATQDNIT
jgi:hypothetical protein